MHKFASKEEEFRASWDMIERFYSKTVTNILFPPMLILIQEMRFNFYDECFRASHAVYSVSLYRQIGRAWLQFNIHEPYTIEITAELNKKHFVLEKHPVRLTSELKALLDMLMVQPIE